MKVLVAGSGGREHALAWKISQSGLVSDIICAPGNGGMSGLAECVEVDVGDPAALASLAVERGADFTVIGPEAPLVDGVVDVFRERDLSVFGPTGRAAMLEGSKSFAKDILEKNGIPTGKARLFTSHREALEYVRSAGPPLVVKADGLAAGKGVIIAKDIETAEKALSDCLLDGVFSESGRQVLVEEFMEGPEVSILSLSDGEAVAHMVPSQDHKRAYDNDEGPNTGGMGAYSPVPLLDAGTEALIQESVMAATVRAMRSDGEPYRGVLYGGLMLTDDGPKVLEFNVRFGDPEAQAVLPRLQSDLLDALLATIDGKVAGLEMKWSPDYCVCVVVASGGYPGKYDTGAKITGIKAAEKESRVNVFHAGTKVSGGELVTSGGRVLSVVARGRDFSEARELAYEAVGMIGFENMHYRTDIGRLAMEQR